MRAKDSDLTRVASAANRPRTASSAAAMLLAEGRRFLRRTPSRRLALIVDDQSVTAGAADFRRFTFGLVVTFTAGSYGQLILTVNSRTRRARPRNPREGL